MERLDTLMPAVLRKRGLMGHASAALITHRANAWFAEHLPAFVQDLRATSLKDKELIITAQHSIAAQECQQCSDQLMRYLREDCGHASELERLRLVRASG